MVEPVFTVGDVIRKFRKERKWSLRKLAAECGIGHMTTSDIENNRANYQKDTLDAIAGAFGKSGADLEALATIPSSWSRAPRRPIWPPSGSPSPAP